MVSVGLPVLTLAATFNPGYVTSLITGGIIITRNLVIFLVSLSVVWFIWNVIKYSMSDDEGGKEKAKSQMINGIIAIAVTVSIWGLVYLLQGMFISGSNGQAPPGLNNMIPLSV